MSRDITVNGVRCVSVRVGACGTWQRILVSGEATPALASYCILYVSYILDKTLEK